MNFLKYLAGGVFFVIFKIIVDVAMGTVVTVSQASLVPYAITTLIAMVAFAIADQLVKSK